MEHRSPYPQGCRSLESQVAEVTQLVSGWAETGAQVWLGLCHCIASLRKNQETVTDALHSCVMTTASLVTWLGNSHSKKRKQQVNMSLSKYLFKSNMEGRLGGSGGWASDSPSQLRSWSQGCEFKPCVGLHAGHEAYLKKKTKTKQNKKNNYISVKRCQVADLTCTQLAVWIDN